MTSIKLLLALGLAALINPFLSDLWPLFENWTISGYYVPDVITATLRFGVWTVLLYLILSAPPIEFVTREIAILMLIFLLICIPVSLPVIQGIQENANQIMNERIAAGRASSSSPSVADRIMDFFGQAPDIDPWVEGGSQYEAVRREVRREIWQPVIKNPVAHFGLRFYLSILVSLGLYGLLLHQRIKRGFLKPSKERTSSSKSRNPTSIDLPLEMN